MSISKQVFNVGGLPTNVYSVEGATDPSAPVAVLFVLHGRTGSAEQIEANVSHKILQHVQEHRKSNSKDAEDLFVLTLDHRNHGARLVDPLGNKGWSENDRHAIDMYSMHTGSARDVSFLIDYLPAYLFPNGERAVSRWIMSGISLGGHSTWVVLKNDPRVKIGIPIIGCPDYITLMEARAEKQNKVWGPPYVPDSLLALIKRDDPAAAPYASSGTDNPFLGKKILVLGGGADKLVPPAAGQTFVDGLNVGGGVKKVSILPGVGHECHPEMVRQLAEFVWEEALAA